MDASSPYKDLYIYYLQGRVRRISNYLALIISAVGPGRIPAGLQQNPCC